MTNGMKTSEFYLTVAGTIAAVGMAFYGIEAAEIFASISLIAAYTGGRSLKKGLVKNGPDQ